MARDAQQFATRLKNARSDGPAGVAEDWLIAECKRVLGCTFKSIERGPGKWGPEYLKRFISDLPACRVAALNGTGRDNEELDVDSRWAIFLGVGWDGKDQRQRSRGERGLFRAVSLLAPWLHNQVVDGDAGVGKVRVMEIQNLYSGPDDLHGCSFASLVLGIPLHFDVPVDCDRFDEFIQAGFLPGARPCRPRPHRGRPDPVGLRRAPTRNPRSLNHEDQIPAAGRGAEGPQGTARNGPCRRRRGGSPHDVVLPPPGG